MMQLLRVEFDNFCQFRSLSIDFTRGVNLVVGRNGAGKSNAMKGVYGAITGDFRSRNDGTTVDNVCQLTSSGVVRVRAELTHGPLRLDVTRTISREGRVSSRLWVGDSDGREEQWTKTTEVTDQILGILGVSPKMLSDYVFVDQWGIFAVLTAQPAERSKAFQRLFGTDKAETIYSVITKHLTAVEVQTTGTALADVRQELTQTGAHISELQGKLILVGNVTDPGPDDPDRKLVRDHGNKMRLLEEAQDYEVRGATHDELLAALQKDHESARVGLDNMRTYLDGEASKAEAYRRQSSLWDTWLQTEVAREHHQADVTAWTAEIARIGPAPHPQHNYVPPEKRGETQEAVNIAKAARAEALRIIACAAEGVCSQCGQSTVGMAEHKEEAERVVAATDKELDRLQMTLALWETFDRNHKGWTYAYDKALNAHDMAKDALAQLPTIKSPETDLHTMQHFLARYDEMSKWAKQAEQSLAEISAAILAAESAKSFLLQEAARKRKDAEAYVVTDEEAQEAAARVIERQDKVLQARELTLHLKTAREARRRVLETLVALEVVERRARIQKAWRARIEVPRNAFHRDSAPRITAQNYLEIIQDELNDLLARFDADFRVTADEGLSFLARFVRGPKAGTTTSTGRLSGGEKVLLGLAFRVVVNGMFAKDLGLLVLDEPTAGLDKVNLGCLDVAFQRLRELSHSRGLQVIMITHEEGLPAADNLIEIK